MASRVCTRCGKEKDDDEFYRNRGDRRPECKTCTMDRRDPVIDRQRLQQWRDNNREHLRKKDREYKQRRRDREAKLVGDVGETGTGDGPADQVPPGQDRGGDRQ